MLLFALLGGCAPAPPGRFDVRQAESLETRALECLKRGVGYEPLASVRIAAIESLQDEAPEAGLPWIRTGLTDEHPAVRFAACMALGTLGDGASREVLLRLLDDPDPSVPVAAVFALHRLGDQRYTGRLAAWLKHHPEPPVRRNAALALGRLGEAGAIPLLAGVVGDADDGLHAQALETMALLGSKDAIKQLTFVANSGIGPQEVLALNALALLGDWNLAETFRYKLEHGDFLEVRLAAARALGEIGSDEGSRVALRALRFNRPKRGIEHDPPENQIMRIRQMAALALGAIGDPAALKPLGERLEDNSDPRIQVAAAKSILRIINRHKRETLPFEGAARGGP